MSAVLEELQAIIESRKGTDPESSYVASLYDQGLNKILEKLGEEGIETIIAAKDCAQGGKREDVIYETADLWFHSMVMLSQLDIAASEVLEELERRFGLSGLDEKAARKRAGD